MTSRSEAFGSEPVETAIGGPAPEDRGLVASFSARRSDDFEIELDLAVPPGRTAALLGPNGAGKSTLVAALAGLLPAEDGRIVLAGRVLDDPAAGVFVSPEKRRAGVVFQDYLLFPHLTILENVVFGPRSRGVPSDARDRGARDWLDRLGLGEMAERRPGDLSGGQAQRAALARALASDPEILLLDEPLAALDVTTRARLRRTLSTHLDSFEGPRLVITHDPAEAFLLADEIHVMEEGRITQVGSAEEIRLRPRTQYAADLAGTNLVRGMASGGEVDAGELILQIPDREIAGPVLVTVRPNAISVHRARPEGSHRNTWRTAVKRIEPLGTRVRILTGSPLPLTVEVTRDAREEMGLDEGAPVWLAVKATELGVQAD